MFSKSIVAVVAAFLLAGCVSAETNMVGGVFQRFEFGNDGEGIVRNVRIMYDNLEFPTTVQKDFGPDHVVVFSESLEIPVPESAELHWTEANGKQHNVYAPIRSMVKNPACFHGFRFFFVDDHVDIYILNRKGDCKHMQGVDTTKVFSSNPSL